MSIDTTVRQSPESARPARRLTGVSTELDFTGTRGEVQRSVRRGRPRLHTRYASDDALLDTRTKRIWTALLVLAALVLPFVVSSGTTYLLTMAAIYAIGGIGLNLLTGYAGQVSLGHALFLGLGAYTAAVFGGVPGRQTWGLELDLAIVLPLAAIIPGLIGLLVAPLATRVRGLYLAVLTLGLLLLGEHVFKEWTAVTGGSGVGRAVAQPVFLGSDLTKTYAVGPLRIEPEVSLYLLALVLLIVGAVAARNLARSRTGRAFAAVRDRDVAARLMGVDITKTKSIAFMISSAYAGLAGALLSLLVGRIAPEQWNLFLSIDFLAIVVIGGAASISGSIIGACFVVLLPRFLESLSSVIPWITTSSGGLINVFQLQTILFGLLIIVFMILEPRGLFGLWHRIKTYFTTWPFSY